MKSIFGFFLKTYKDDYNYVKRLINSFNKHNKDDLLMYIMCSSNESVLFKKFESENIRLLNEEKLGHYLVNDFSINNISPGYVNQCILKLSFWELGLLENYFCIDSEVVFIEDFLLSDFITENNIPYSFLIEDNELKVDPIYNNEYNISRDKTIDLIKSSLKLNSNKHLTIHGNTTLSSLVLKCFKKEILEKRNISYKDLMKISLMEFTWYNFYLQKEKPFEIIVREPIIKTFHNFYNYNDYLRKGITINDISRGYKGYLINSNFSRASGVINYGENNYVPTLKVLSHQIKILFILILNKFKYEFKKIF